MHSDGALVTRTSCFDTPGQESTLPFYARASEDGENIRIACVGIRFFDVRLVNISLARHLAEARKGTQAKESRYTFVIPSLARVRLFFSEKKSGSDWDPEEIAIEDNQNLLCWCLLILNTKSLLS
jgi:hypothetical protein